jgi:hypothetical protein
MFQMSISTTSGQVTRFFLQEVSSFANLLNKALDNIKTFRRFIESALEMYYEIPNVKVDDVRTGIRNRYDAGFSAPTRRLANHLGGADGGADEY